MQKPVNKFLKDAAKKLPFIKSISLTLENGEAYTLDFAAELFIPSDLGEVLFQAAIEAPGRLGFIDGQTERALHVVRMAETALRELEGRANAQRRLLIEKDREGELVAENAVDAAVNCRPDVVAARKNLNQLRLHYGLLRALRDAASHRVFILNRLIDPYAKSHSGHYGKSGE